MPVTTSVKTQATHAHRVDRPARPRVSRQQARRVLAGLLARGALTQRDKRLLEYLREFKVMSLAQVRRLLWPQTTEWTAYLRLNLLARNHLLSRVRSPQADMAAWGLPPALVYALGPAGWLWLQGQANIPKWSWKRSRLVSALLSAELGVRLTEQTFQQGEQWALTIAGQAAAAVYAQRAAKRPLIAPDLLVVVSHQSGPGQVMRLPLLVEIDAARPAVKSGTRWGRRVAGYNRLAAGNWRRYPLLAGLEQFPQVLVITHGTERLLNLIDETLTYRRAAVSYHLALWADVLAGRDILTDPIWLTLTPGQAEPQWRQSLARRPLDQS
jgi:hypothetical protein